MEEDWREAVADQDAGNEPSRISADTCEASRRKVLMGTAGILSFSQEAANAKVGRMTLGRARTSVAEDVLQSNLAALDDFIERTLNLVKSGRSRVSHLVEFHEWDETPQSCVLEGAQPGRNIAHLLQAHFGLTVASRTATIRRTSS